MKSMIGEWRPPLRFTDVQLRGPFLFWKHAHDFEERNGGVMMRDRITYALPWAPLSGIALPAVRRNVERAFAFRRRAIAEIFGS
jgi:ligand-binding SRPBCC domain-containing protein